MLTRMGSKGASHLVLGVAVLSYAASLVGAPILGIEPYILCVALALGAGVTGVAVNRPKPVSAWVMFMLAMLFFLGGTGGRELAGDPSYVTRPLLPDVIVVLGYLSVAIGVVLMMRHSARALDVDGVIDATLVSVSATALAWALLSSYVFPSSGVDLAHAVSLASFPALSLFVLALLLYYSAGHGLRSISASNRYFIGALTLLFAGDTLGVVADVGLGDLKDAVNTVYSLASVCLVLMTLHPSVNDKPSAYVRRGPASALRLLAVGAALVVPVSVVSVVGSTASGRDRVVLAVLLFVLLALAAYKTARAVSAQGRALVEAAHAHAQVSYQASHDALTGLPNRASAITALDAALESSRAGRAAAVMFLDLDRFKHVNDTHGHAVGDQLIIAAGARLAEEVRGSDVVARLGGDEFVVVMLDASRSAAVEAAERINRSLARPFMLEGVELLTGSTLGVYLPKGTESTGAALLEAADTALYQGKRGGRNQVVVFEEGMGAADERQILIEEHLRGALERGELSMVFQPLVDVAENVVGAEALMRWNSPELGQVGPAEFITVAETSDLVLELGHWALVEACQQGAAWAAAGTPVQVSVNVSARQLEAGGFADQVREALADAGLAGELLDVEITEGVLLNQVEEVRATLEEVRAMGVGVSVDDFGTGYSSLAYLKRFPVTRLKIDRTFVQGLADPDGSDRALVGAVVAMAKALELSVTAEGVETRDQADEVVSMGAELMQGYLFAKPGPAGELRPARSCLPISGPGSEPESSSDPDAGTDPDA